MSGGDASTAGFRDTGAMPGAAASKDQATHLPVAEQSSPLMQYLLSVLSPLLVVGSMTDPHLARLAAAEAIAACQARGRQDLMAAGQIVGLGVAMLDDLRLSAPPEVSVSLKLKLRGNAAALNRAGQAMTAELRRLQRDDPRSPPADAAQEARARQAARAALAAARAAVRQAEAEARPPGSAAVARAAATDDDGHSATTGTAAQSAAAATDLTMRGAPQAGSATESDPALRAAPQSGIPAQPADETVERSHRSLIPPAMEGAPDAGRHPGPAVAAAQAAAAEAVEDRRPLTAAGTSAQLAAAGAKASWHLPPLATAPPVTAEAQPDGQSASLAASVQPAVPARQRAIAWAKAMTEVAAEFAQGLDRLPPGERQADLARIGILSDAARRLCQGGAPCRAALLGSTWLTGDPADQASSASTAKLASQCSSI